MPVESLLRLHKLSRDKPISDALLYKPYNVLRAISDVTSNTDLRGRTLSSLFSDRLDLPSSRVSAPCDGDLRPFIETDPDT